MNRKRIRRRSHEELLNSRKARRCSSFELGQSESCARTQVRNPLKALALLFVINPEVGLAACGLPSIIGGLCSQVCASKLAVNRLFGASTVKPLVSLRVPLKLRGGAASSRSRSADSRLVTRKEQTYIMIKPDGVQRGLVGEIIKRFEQRGYRLKAMKLLQPSEEILRQHYKDHVEKPFFPKILKHMLSGPVVCMVWEGENVVKMGRQMLGATNPQESPPGTIRGDFAIEACRNLCHGSDSPENAEREINLWFDKDELSEVTSRSKEWLASQGMA